MRLRIDFRLILPGLLIFLIGVAFFVVWLVLAVVSFFLFFFPATHGIFYFVLDLLFTSLCLMAVGAILALSGARGWWRGAWSGRDTEVRPREDRLKASERVGQFVGVVVSLLVLYYFYESQVLATGFFTPAFGPAEQLAFYGPIVLGMIVSLVRGAYGKKNAVRPLQSLQGGVLALSSLWLLYKFPFEFAHLTALLPGFVRVAFWWVSNPIGQLLLVLGVIGGFVSMVVHAVQFALTS